jgi:hypothetical protein
MDLPLKEGESVEQRERFTSLLKRAHDRYSDGRPAGVEQDFGPGELVLTNKSLFLVADRSN